MTDVRTRDAHAASLAAVSKMHETAAYLACGDTDEETDQVRVLASVWWQVSGQRVRLATRASAHDSQAA